jgi:hypothetical protein
LLAPPLPVLLPPEPVDPPLLATLPPEPELEPPLPLDWPPLPELFEPPLPLLPPDPSDMDDGVQAAPNRVRQLNRVKGRAEVMRTMGGSSR